jgi:hypothetical protein
MPRSRTIKSLAALVMAMTVGTFVLMLLELQADPLRSPVEPLSAVAAPRADFEWVLSGTKVPVQLLKWRNVIVHSAPDPDGTLPTGCHFLVQQHPDDSGSYVIATARWRHQVDGRHVAVPGYDYNRNSIGICLIGDFSSRPPERDQFDAVVGLVRELRRYCRISSDHVYLGKQLPLRRKSPGDAFPAALFEDLVKAPVR